MIQLIEKTPTAEEHLSLRLRSGMGTKDLARSQMALNNSLFVTTIYDDETLIAFGRVVGDSGITYVVSDIMVDEAYRRRGLAEQIMLAIDRYFDAHAHEDSYICLIANQPADQLYRKHHFDNLPEDKCGMLRNQAAWADADKV